MSVSESVGLILATMGFVQLALGFAAVTGYVLTLNPSLTARSRTIAALAALVAMAAFAFTVPSWMGGVVVMAMAVAGISAFAACAWLCARMLGLAETGSALVPVAPQRAGLRSPAPQVTHVATAPGAL